MKSLRTLLNTIFGAAFFCIIAALAWLILERHLPVLGHVTDTLRCTAGVPAADSACVQDMIADLDAARLDIARQRDALDASIAAQSFVFTQGAELADHISLVVGTLYDDARAQAGFLRAYCWAVVDHQGLDPRVGLAIREADGTVSALPLTSDDLTLLEMSRGDVDAARAACPFPDVN